MLKEIKFGKLLLVVTITMLIWIWADLAQDEKISSTNALITVSKSTNPNLLVNIDGRTAVSLEEIVLKGPASRIAEQKRKIKLGKRFDFDFDPVSENMDQPGRYTLTLLPFLQKDRDIKKLGLKIESSKPATISVNVMELAEKSLLVKCFDKEQNLIKPAAVEPAQVNMFVPVDWAGEMLIAKVLLTRIEINQAAISPIEKTPYIELPGGKARSSDTVVKIMMPPAEELLADYAITTATLGITLSANLQGKYKVEVKNLDEVIRAIIIRATTEAKRAYENMPYQLILEIDDEDARAAEPLRRKITYNFPLEYVRKNEILLKQQPVIAQFQLVPTGKVSNSEAISR
jgi:hypothetical protein